MAEENAALVTNNSSFLLWKSLHFKLNPEERQRNEEKKEVNERQMTAH